MQQLWLLLQGHAQGKSVGKSRKEEVARRSVAERKVKEKRMRKTKKWVRKAGHLPLFVSAFLPQGC